MSIGNHAVPYSTESHVAKSMELLGHEVVRIQENEVGWAERLSVAESCQLAWWCSTWDYAHRWDQAEAHAAIDKLNGMLPTVAHHLDLFHGLSRAHMVTKEPWFKCRWVFTADGDHYDDWVRAGVNHRWMPPAVFGPECTPGRYRPSMASDVAFVGAHTAYGHPEWEPHRLALLAAVREHFGRRFRCWPERGKPAVRGAALNDLYASASVVLGDSCLATTSTTYHSDRAWETVGRGGALVFPRIPGLTELLIEGEHCAYYTPGDHDDAIAQIEQLLDDAQGRQEMIVRGMAHVRANHSYANRVQSILDTLRDEGAL